MATTYNCEIRNPFGVLQDDVVTSNNMRLRINFGPAGHSGGIDVIGTETAIGFINNRYITDTYLPSLGYSDVQVDSDSASILYIHPEYISESGDILDIERFSSFSGLDSPFIDFYVTPPSSIVINFQGRRDGDVVLQDYTHTINITDASSVRLRTVEDIASFLTLIGFEVTIDPFRNNFEYQEAPQSIVCAEQGGGSSTSTVTISDFSESTIVNVIDGSVSNTNILKQFKTIQDADAAGTLDIDSANETLTNLYNEL